MSAVPAVLALEGRQLRIAVRADHAQVLARVVGGVAVDVVEDEDQAHTHPVGRRTTDGAASALILKDVLLDEVATTSTHGSDFAGLEPPARVLGSLHGALTSIAAELLLMRSDEFYTAAFAGDRHDANVEHASDTEINVESPPEPEAGIEPATDHYK